MLARTIATFDFTPARGVGRLRERVRLGVSVGAVSRTVLGAQATIKLLIFKYFTDNSFRFKDLAALPLKSLILKDRAKGGVKYDSQHHRPEAAWISAGSGSSLAVKWRRNGAS